MKVEISSDGEPVLLKQMKKAMEKDCKIKEMK